MGDSDVSTENEPLIGIEEVSSAGTKNAFNVKAEHVPKELSTLGIKAVFVVAFDTNHGNVIEWCKPDFMKEQLSGLEFKAIPSGAHTLESDMVYLYDAELYGVACYAKLSVDSAKERGARMKSVGVLCQSFDLIHIHKPKLVTLVRELLENPTDYTRLQAHYDLWSGTDAAANMSSLSTVDLGYPARHFEQLLYKLGPSIFTIWKAMLLQRRILFHGQPPAAELCHSVRCADVMMTGTDRLRSNVCTPFFFVNIADCDVLSRQLSYIACTTEKVFETKSNIYDVYVDNYTVKITTASLSTILRPTSGDKLRLSHLHSILRRPVSCDDNPMSVEDNFYSYFKELNRAIADRLNRSAISDDMTLTSRDMLAVGLDNSDSAFIYELIDSLNLDITYTDCGVCGCLPG